MIFRGVFAGIALFCIQQSALASAVLTFFPEKQSAVISADLYFYGKESTPERAAYIAREIELNWNRPRVWIIRNGVEYLIAFHIRGYHIARWEAVLLAFKNRDPKKNLIALTEKSECETSCWSGLFSNSGNFTLQNIMQTATTASHEFGHGLGLDHPDEPADGMKGPPGIMFPRGTEVEPRYRLDPFAAHGTPEYYMNPEYRRVLASEVLAVWKSLKNQAKKSNSVSIGHVDNLIYPDEPKSKKNGD